MKKYAQQLEFAELCNSFVRVASNSLANVNELANLIRLLLAHADEQPSRKRQGRASKTSGVSANGKPRASARIAAPARRRQSRARAPKQSG